MSVHFLPAGCAISVIIPAHSPDLGRLERVLEALRRQTLAATEWETVIVDNASATPLDARFVATVAPLNCRVVREEQLGLTQARERGLAETTGELVAFVDDDNVLGPDYLAHAVGVFQRQPKLGAAGGRSLPEFAQAPEPWQSEFYSLLALRDFGPEPKVATSLRPTDAIRNEYPSFAPIGAGMVLRRCAADAWRQDGHARRPSDRRGTDLGSAGDNDIVFTVLAHGWHVGYFPELVLTHLIPRGRLCPEYLARLNRAVQKSWVEVLARHDANPWRPIAPWSLPLRRARAWLRYRAWRSPAARIRWAGACGRFEGLAAID